MTTYLSRYLCDVLADMRSALKVLRIDLVAGLIEEAQIMGNKMESKLNDYSDMRYNLEKGKELQRGIDAVAEDLDNLDKWLRKIKHDGD